MKWKIALAIIGLVVVCAVLFAATASAFMTNQNYNGNFVSGGSNRWGPFGYGESEDNYREGGMMNAWGTSDQKSTGPSYFDDDGWGWHE